MENLRGNLFYNNIPLFSITTTAQARLYRSGKGLPTLGSQFNVISPLLVRPPGITYPLPVVLCSTRKIRLHLSKCGVYSSSYKCISCWWNLRLQFCTSLQKFVLLATSVTSGIWSEIWLFVFYFHSRRFSCLLYKINIEIFEISCNIFYVRRHQTLLFKTNKYCFR